MSEILNQIPEPLRFFFVLMGISFSTWTIVALFRFFRELFTRIRADIKILETANKSIESGELHGTIHEDGELKLVIVHKWQNLDDLEAWLKHQLANVEAELKRLKEAESNHKSVNFDGTSDTMQIEKKD